MKEIKHLLVGQGDVDGSTFLVTNGVVEGQHCDELTVLFEGDRHGILGVCSWHFKGHDISGG